MTNPTDPAAVEAWRAAYAAVYGCEITHPAYMYAILQSYGDQREAAARADERARCAAWLRGMFEKTGFDFEYAAYPEAADAIERGDHLKGSGDDL